jgi:hypothetical protein
MAARFIFSMSLLICGCAQAVGMPDPEPQNSSSDDAGAPPAVEAAAPLRTGTYFGDYVVSSGGGQMLLIVKDDGYVTLTPADQFATGTGTIDEAGNVDVTTQFDGTTNPSLRFTGTVKLDATGWKASGKVSADYESGTWAAVRK